MIRWPRFLSWAARRLSGRPFSAAGSDEKAPSSPTPGGESQSIRFRILIPLAAAFCLVIGSFWAILYWHEQAELEDQVVEDTRSVQKHFEQEAKNQAETMSAALDALRSDNQLGAAFRARDRSALLERARPVFDRLHAQHDITHFYFTAPGRVNILRVHQPDRFGDTLDRVTTLRAQETGETSAGLELGPLGTFALRVVVPWKDEEGLVGYVELGKEIDGIFRAVEKAAGADLCVFVSKKYLTREGYEAGMRMLGRRPEWARFSTAVLVHQTRDAIPQQILSLLAAEHSCLMKAAKEDVCGVGVEELDDGRVYTCEHSCLTEAVKEGICGVGVEELDDGRVCTWRFFCLEDAAGRHVGDVAVLRDVTLAVTDFRKSIALGAAVCVLVGGLLFVFFYAFLGRVQDRLHGAQQRVVEEARAREDTQRRHAEDLQKAHAHLETIINAVAEPFLVIDRDYRIVLANAVVRAAAGGVDPVALGLRCHQVSHRRDTPCDSKEDPCPLRTVLATRQPVRVIHTHYTAEGESRVVEITASPVFDEAGEVVQMIESCRDITDRKRMEGELRRLAFIAQQATEGIAVADLEGNLQFVNDVWARMHGYESGAELVGKHLRVFHTDEQLKTDVIPFNEVVIQRGHNAGEVGHVRKDGTTFPAQMMVTLLKDEQGEPYGLAGFAQDITARKRAEKVLQQANVRLEELATTDALTGLANRRRFMEVLEAEFQRSRRYGGRLALAMVDVDRFKRFNDAHGHAFGDRVLVEVAKRLAAEARQTDVVARLGGDEFIVLMPETSADEAVRAAERIRKTVSKNPISDGERSVLATVSVGIGTVENGKAGTPESLLKQADDAMYAAKEAGRNRVCLAPSEKAVSPPA